jgi:hypothetical protein
MTGVMQETEQKEVLPKIGSKFTETDKRSLRDISRELLLKTGKKTRVPMFEIDDIMEEAVTLLAHLISMGNNVRMPHGVMGIVIMPEDVEFSNMGIASKLFPDERLIISAFSKEMEEWGYENIPSGKMNRALRKRLDVPKCASKIKLANETNVLRYSYFKSHRKLRE